MFIFVSLNTQSFARTSNVSSLANKPSQHFNVGSPLFQRCGSTLKQRQSDVENETKSDVGFSTLHNVNTKSVSEVKSTLHNVNTTVFQRCTTSFQRCFNVDMTLSQRCFNVVSTSVKAISKSIWVVKSMNLQKD